MKTTSSLLALAAVAILPAGYVQAQGSLAPAAAKPASSPTASASPTAAGSPASTVSASGATARPEVYHVHFTHAVPGKAAQLAESLKKPDPTSPNPGHSIMLRHQEGDSWDYVVIEHLGPKATVDAARPAVPNADRDLSDSHTDTFVNGPSWADFSKAVGINEGAGKSAIYIVSVYRPVPGHRDQLEKMLTTPDAGDPAAGHVLLQHLEGAAWSFLSVVRYATWDDFVKGETGAAASQANGPSSRWSAVREHVSFHTDTLADRIAP